MSDHPVATPKLDSHHSASPAASGDMKGDGHLHSSIHGAPAAFERLGHSMESLRAEAVPRMEAALADAQSYGRERIAALRDSATALRHRAERAGDTTRSYVREQPVQALLIAAASGAVLMGVLSMWRRASRND